VRRLIFDKEEFEEIFCKANIYGELEMFFCKMKIDFLEKKKSLIAGICREGDCMKMKSLMQNEVFFQEYEESYMKGIGLRY